MSRWRGGVNNYTKERVDEWNAAVPIGTVVRFWPGVKQGPGKLSRTKSQAFLVGGERDRTAVVFVEDEGSYLQLSNVATEVDDPEEWAKALKLDELREEECDLCEDGVITERSCKGTEELTEDGLGCGVIEEFHSLEEHGHEFVFGEEHFSDCPNCKPPSYTFVGLTYVAVGEDGRACVLDSDNTVLLHELGELGGDPEDAGLDCPGEGIWKAVVSFWSSRGYYGDYDSGFNATEWIEVESYPEPPCGAAEDPPCQGMRLERGGGAWACDKHAGQVA